MISDTVQDANQAIHNDGMAVWVGGTTFGRFAHNPSLRQISSRAERGAVTNAAWNGFNRINAASLAAVAAGHVAGRLSGDADGDLELRAASAPRIPIRVPVLSATEVN